MKIYKVRAWVNQRVKRGKDRVIEHPFFREAVFVNKEGAQIYFREMVNAVQSYTYLSRVESIHVELFHPHIFDDGSLAYWPDDDKYIERWEWPEK